MQHRPAETPGITVLCDQKDVDEDPTTTPETQKDYNNAFNMEKIRKTIKNSDNRDLHTYIQFYAYVYK